MKWIRQAWVELIGLFVDDGSFAVSVVLWVLAAIFLFPKFLPPHWKGPALFAGVIAILFENVNRTARRIRKR
ncbi:MAG TPA: hypothetical protein VLI55_22745 [Bryobacteraceae bacterium]|nr:hypothetical protein [Bryobacteraceae bacterium]